PAWIRGRADGRVVWGSPRVYSGDEPHYLVMINSLIEDGDLDLSNNYQSVHEGSFQAGLRFRAKPLDHHVAYYVNGKYNKWDELFEWGTDDKGRIVPRPRPDLDESLAVEAGEYPEYGAHPPGLALLIAPFLLPFRGTYRVESAAVLFSTVAVFLLALLMRQ